MTDGIRAVIADKVTFAYEGASRNALDGVCLEIPKGSYVALLGANGSGKSTFARLVDVIEVPGSGTVKVFGLDTKEDGNFWGIRSHTGCVFQNPDNQIVGTTVEEDVAFGPENLGIPNPELTDRVMKAIEFVGLKGLETRQSAALSGGQKQKLAIAGVLSMKPDLLILDEATAMLDPLSRDELMALVGRLVRDGGITVITITHDMTEASKTDEVFIMEKGKIALHGKPSDILSNVDEMIKAGLDSPLYSRLVHELSKISGKPYDKEDNSSLISSLSWVARNFEGVFIPQKNETPSAKEKLLSVKDLSYSYEKGQKVLKDISLDVYRGEMLALVGRSGCGKTTLISHLNGIIRPQEGDVEFLFEGQALSTRKKGDVKKIRQKVGLVFQYPEYQLFEETVYKDIAYGPKMMGMNEDEQREAVLKAVRAVGLDEELLEKSPFELSGGQQRRVAMAGVISMGPEVLVLDEPAAGLDPKGRRDMFNMIDRLKRENGTTIILVTHYMDEAYEHADRICCMKGGVIMKVDTPALMFRDEDELASMEIRKPYLRRYLEIVASRLNIDEESKTRLIDARSISEASSMIGGTYA